MKIDLSLITFDNDMYQTDLPDGSIIVFNLIDESLYNIDYSYRHVETNIKRINIEIIDLEGNSVMCPCVIGMGNDLMQVNTLHTEYEGKVLNNENMQFCEVEVYDKE